MSQDVHGAMLFAKAWLETAGYRIAFRNSGWSECLVWLGSERWLGRGADEVEALGDALGQMLPSRASRFALPEELRRLLDEQPAAPVVGSRQEAFVALPAPEPPAPSLEAVPTPVEQLAPPPEPPAVMAAVEPGHPVLVAAVEPEPPATLVETDPVEAPEPPPAVASDESAQLEPPPPHPPVAAAPPRLTVKEAIEALEPLLDRITAERPELGLTTPPRQRLVLTSWICQARAIEDAAGGEPSIVNRVADIARDLTSLCKVWWPGSVIALQLSTTPKKALRNLQLPPDAVFPPTWDGAASAAEKMLARLVEDESGHGRDEYGWADSAMLHPPPNSPETELGQLKARLEKLTGPVAGPPPKELHDEKQPSPGELALYLEWGRLIRWLRGSVIDFETWSRLMGRLRWLAQDLSEAGHELTQVLDPAFKPASTWASVLGRDPEEKKRKAQRFKLYRRADVLKQGDREELRAWLADALKLIDNEAIVSVLNARREAALSLVPEEVAETRGERRRVRKIQEALRDGSGAASSPPPVEAHLEETAANEEEESAPVEDPGARLFSIVRPHTEGRRIIFVSNRNDPLLAELLRTQFGFAEIDWCDANPRKVQTTTERISSSSCDYVLAATGFQSHSVDGKLYDACKRAGVRYLRVNKGRPVACAVAFARGLAAPEERLSSP